MTTDLKTLDDSLNQMIMTGKAMEAFDRFYDKDVEMQENADAPCVGLAANLEREKQFFAMVEEWKSSKILSQAIGDGVSVTEWENEFKLKGMPAMQSRQVAVRRWKNGKVVSERFYHKGW